jgi:RNA polymerase sigma-54 factor
VKALNPKPGNAFGSLFVQAVIADAAVRAAPDGGWLVELNSDTLPRLLVNRQYLAKVSRSGQREGDKVYLSECLANAQWLVKSLDQRARTILKVAKEIVRQQDGFLIEGVAKLKPLNLKTVAEAIGMHESTVSRVTSNKFMATPRGTFELKYFFTTGLSSTSGSEELFSAEAVRHRIRQLIEAEPARTVLSDDQIVEQLRSEGVDLARRTVAKYREAMGIPSSVRRRREKHLKGNDR